LAIRVTINFQGLTEPGGLGENTWPVCFQAKSIIVDAATWMAENLNVRIAQGSKVSIGLVVNHPQGRMKRA
jgi:hypothetical protein